MGIGIWSWRLAPFVAALCAAAASPLSATDANGPPETVIAQLRELGAAANHNDCKGVLHIGEPLLSQKSAGLPADAEAATYELVANCAYSEGAKQKAYDYALRGSRLAESADDLWHLRLFLENQAKNFGAAVATVEEMSAGRGAALNSTPMGWFWELHRDLKAEGARDLRTRLLKVLAADSYLPEESSGDAQGLHYQYAIMLAEGHDTAGARAMLRGIKDPGLLTEGLFDPRLRGFLPAGLDLRASTEAQLTIDREARARYPDRLDPILKLTSNLRRLGRPQEALTLLQSVEREVDDPAAFKDRDQKLPWYWDELGRTYVALGRYDDAVAAFRKGIAAGESSGLNVSQTINLADAQIQFGRGDEALKTLSGFDDPKREASPFGLMEMHLARGCAQAMAGHAGTVAADLDYAKAHEKDDPEALGNLYLCLDRMDDAAASFIRRLDDLDLRSATLKQLSDYEDRPANVPSSPFEIRLKTLKERVDVRAAIERAGGTRHIPLQPPDL
jgi:tetratricopeptide (TPR) repeat protein